MQIIYLFINCYIICSLFYIYGYFLVNKSYYDNNLSEVAFTVLFGSISISLISLSINFIFPLNVIVGNIFLGSAIFIFLKFILKNIQIYKLLKNIFYISLLSTTLILYENINRPDAGLYHLPYLQILHENKIIIGLSNLHFRFGHISSNQYFSGIFNNSFMPIEALSLPVLILMCSFLVFLISFFDKNHKDNSLKILIFLITIYSLYSFNRFSNYGNDASAHAFAFIYLIYVCKKKIYHNDLIILILISAFLFTQKIFMSLLIITTFLIFVLNKNIKKVEIIRDYRFLFSAILICFWLLKNFLITGCLIYPVEKTCYENISYSNIEKTKQVRIESEAWAKDWSNYKEIIIPSEYIKKFNWVETWKQNHLNKIKDKLLPFIIFLLMFVSYCFFLAKKPKTKNKIDKFAGIKLLIVLITSFLIFIFWFLKFPLYRYGQSIILAPILILIYYIISKITDLDKLHKPMRIIVGTCLAIIIIKNFDRIIKYNQIRNIWPNIYTLSENPLDNFKKELEVVKIDDKFVYFYSSDGECMYSKAPCTNFKIKNLVLENKFGYDIYYTKK